MYRSVFYIKERSDIMFSKGTFGTQRDLIIHIGQKLGKKFKYKTLNVYSMNNDESYQFITIESPNKNNIYLNLFVEENDNNYKIFVLKKIIGKYCIGELTEEEKRIVFAEKNQLYNYEEVLLCMEDVSEKNIEEIISYANEKDDFQSIYISLSLVEGRKMVSEFIQNYMFLLEELKKIDPASEEYSILSKMDIKTEIIDRIAKSCMYSKKAKKFLVQVNPNNIWLNAKIHLLNKDESYETLYLSVDTQNLAIFYLLPINGQWERRVLPNNISEISELFIVGAS